MSDLNRAKEIIDGLVRAQKSNDHFLGYCPIILRGTGARTYLGIVPPDSSSS